MIAIKNTSSVGSLCNCATLAQATMKKVLTVICLAIGTVWNAAAQTPFIEGRIVYDIYLGEDLTKSKGEFVVVIKGEQMKQEMISDGGLYNLLIRTSNTSATVYSHDGNKKLAKRMDAATIANNNKQFEGAVYSNGEQTKTIAGYPCQQISIIYANGMSNTIFYTPQLIGNAATINAQFAQLRGLPLQYQISAGKTQITLVARKVEVVPVEASEFDEPKGYQVVR
jgi:hypothetical protein